jgi:hypothetical protein
MISRKKAQKAQKRKSLAPFRGKILTRSSERQFALISHGIMNGLTSAATSINEDKDSGWLRRLHALRATKS